MSSEIATIIIAGVAAGASVLSLVANFFIIARQQRHIERREFNMWLRDKQLEAFINAVESLVRVSENVHKRWGRDLGSQEDYAVLADLVADATGNLRRAEANLVATMGKTEFTDDFANCIESASLGLSKWVISYAQDNDDAAFQSLNELNEAVIEAQKLADRFNSEIQPARKKR